MKRSVYKKLPLVFDVQQLRDGLTSEASGGWQRHFKGYHYSGEWAALALRSRSGAVDDLKAGPPETIFRDTPLMDASPYIRDQVLGALRCRHLRVRYMRLSAGSSIHEHIDSYEPETNDVRFHVPIITNPKVEFTVGGESLRMLPGECWYIDTNTPHSVANLGDEDRVHLVIDCEINSWVRSMIPAVPGDSLWWYAKFHLTALKFRWRDAKARSASDGRSAAGIVSRQILASLARRFEIRTAKG